MTLFWKCTRNLEQRPLWAIQASIYTAAALCSFDRDFPALDEMTCAGSDIILDDLHEKNTESVRVGSSVGAVGTFGTPLSSLIIISAGNISSKLASA
jgi:hypothetical protein